MQIQVFQNTIENVELGKNIGLHTKYHKKPYALDILHIFSYYVHSERFYIFQISHKCIKVRSLPINFLKPFASHSRISRSTGRSLILGLRLS